MGNMDVQFPVFGSKQQSQYTVFFRKLYFFINILAFLNIMNSLLFHIFS